MSFEVHNEETRNLWKDFNARNPKRVPVQWSMNYRMILLDSSLNPKDYSFVDVFESPEALLKVQLEFEYWKRHRVWCDWDMGLPEKWNIGVGFQNIYESAWLGAPLFFSAGQVPDVKPFLKTREDMKHFMDNGIPGSFTGLMAKVKAFYEYFLEKREAGFTFKEIPLGDIGVPRGTDGSLTIAVNITGGEIIKLLYRDPDFAERFLWFITEALMERMKDWHKFTGTRFPYEGFVFADDSIELLSPKAYRRFVLPLHRQIVDTFCTGRPGIHLCGDVEHHLETLRDELRIRYLDAGFPLNMERARGILGEDVIIKGNLHIATLLGGPRDKIREETLRILKSGVTEGRRFIFGEGNNVAPKTSPENLNYAYETVKLHGKY